MICVECSFPGITTLYTQSKQYIKLTTCPQCHKVVDRYIEYDNVILFLDLLLLKPQAYRHLAYNVVESELRDNDHSQWRIGRYRKLLRLITMTILFEVYIVWAYEERNPTHSVLMSSILSNPVHIQYLYFVWNVVLEYSIFVISIIVQFYMFCNWRQVSSINIEPQFHGGYRVAVLLVTIFTSSAMKTFPILMLIWPYDQTSILANTINVVALAITAEALHVNTRASYTAIVAILGVSVVLQQVLSKVILGVLLGHPYEVGLITWQPVPWIWDISPPPVKWW